MADAQDRLTRAEIEAFATALDFAREFAVRIVSIEPGEVTIELPFEARFSGPPGQFPISIVGIAGDVAAVMSCLSLLPPAGDDFTVKMTGAAKGERLRAKGRVLQAGRTNSVGAADIYGVSGDDETLCRTVLAANGNFQIKPEKSAA